METTKIVKCPTCGRDVKAHEIRYCSNCNQNYCPHCSHQHGGRCSRELER